MEGKTRCFLLPPRMALGARAVLTVGLLALYGTATILDFCQPSGAVVAVAFSPALALVILGLLLARRGVGTVMSATVIAVNSSLAYASLISASPLVYAICTGLGMLGIALLVLFTSFREHITVSNVRLDLSFRLMGEAYRERVIPCEQIKAISADDFSGDPSIVLIDLSEIRIARNTFATSEGKRWLAAMLRLAVVEH